ncbi:beta-lactamase class A [Selenomonas ruminantium]|uniref:Beta-lactamase class A n=1 Tax=Selenomonas ruminantium TaxID=971 RepID=A0A1M6R1L0_SELRU|nr:serine hydrolase [Selenomonas ruminantium]SHK26276.1 beta-lactamase class A [Selenomonas ruminantium]
MKRKVRDSVTFKRIFTFFCVVVVLEVGGIVSAALWMQHDEGGLAAQAAATPQKKNFIRVDRAADEADLQANTARIIGDSVNQMSVYFLRPDREMEPFLYNQRQLSPASIIKLFVMAKTMQDVHDGKLNLTDKITIRKKDVVGGAGVLTWYDAGQQRTVLQLLTVMITDSDNTATNLLIDRLGGMKSINQYLAQYGYTDTVLAHKMMIGNGGRKNLSSVRDLGHLLTRLYYHQLVGPEEDEIMLDILKQQHDKECLGSALPEYVIAHKTGEVTGVYADGGVFFGQNEDFILVILNNGTEGRVDTIDKMQKLAKYYASTIEN